MSEPAPRSMTPTDFRRAAALLTHYQHRDVPGVHAVLAEDPCRTGELIVALLALVSNLAPQLADSDHRAHLRGLLLLAAGEEQ